MVAPAAPTTFRVATGYQSRTRVSDSSVTVIDYASITWNATALGTAFSHYEIDRSDDNRVTWNQIANIITESIASFADYEAPRGTTPSYRMRVVNTSSESSTSTGPNTTTLSAIGCEWLFVSNVTPSENCGFEVPPNRVYSFLNGPDVVFKKLWQRDYQAAFTPLEDRGDQFQLGLIVRFDFDTVYPAPGIAAFAPLRALCEDTALPYVCVLDPYGNRWFAKVQVPKGSEDHSSGASVNQYLATVTVTEITDTPYAAISSTAMTWGSHNPWRSHKTWRGH